MHHFTDELTDQFFSKIRVLAKQFSGKKEQLRPFITISRESGSGGRPIAQMVAQELHFELYDKKFLDEIAKSAKRKPALIRAVDQKARSKITDVVQSVLNPEYISDVTYLHHVEKVVITRAQKGNVIFLDRGTNFMVSGVWALRVRIQAPYKSRVGWAVQHEKISIDIAKERIAKHDTERKEFVHQYFNRNISNANYYDLIINTKHLTIEDARDLIVFAFKKKFKLKS